MTYDISGLGSVERILLYPVEKPVSLSFQPVAEYVSFLRNSVFVYPFKGQRIYTVRLKFDNRTDFYSFLNFFKECKGSLKKFWIPSWLKEFEVIEDIINTARIKIMKCDFSNRWDGNLRLFIWSKDRFIVRQIVSFSLNDYVELELNQQITGFVYVNDILMTGLVHLVRFQESDIEFRIYYSSSQKFFAETNFNVIELPHEYSEV